jgi:ribosomal protein S6
MVIEGEGLCTLSRRCEMAYEHHRKHPLSDDEIGFLKEMRKFGLRKIARELTLSHRAFYSTVSRAIKTKTATENFLTRLRSAHKVLTERTADQKRETIDDGFNYLEYNAYPLLDALLRKSKDKILYQEVADHAMATFVDLCNQHGEEKGTRVALIVLDLES